MIYFLDKDPKEAAAALGDKGLGMMLVNSVQVLCAVCSQFDIEVPYKSYNYNDIVVIWARTSLSNFTWMRDYATAIGEEYIKRTGNFHATIKVLKEIPTPELPDISFTDFPRTLPDRYRTDDIVQDYRDYYVSEKTPVFDKTEAPLWFTQCFADVKRTIYMEHFEEFDCRLRVYDSPFKGITVQSDVYGGWVETTDFTMIQSLIERLCINLSNRRD